MSRLLRLEFQKIKRLRSLPVIAGTIVATVAMACISLFQHRFHADAAAGLIDPWAELLASFSLVNALLAPIMVAVITSRQTEIEHHARGWLLMAAAGHPPGRICRVKWLTLMIVITSVVAIETLGLIACGLVSGLTASIPLAPYLLYAGLLVLVNTSFMGAFLILSARVENQLITLAAGLLSAFIASFGMLIPTSIAIWMPWGYYAAISPTTFSEQGFMFAQPAIIPALLFSALTAIAFGLITRSMTTIEG